MTETPLRRELRGVVERITFQNPEIGFTMVRLAAERCDRQDRVAAAGDQRLNTVVGVLHGLSPGGIVVARRWGRNDGKHGGGRGTKPPRTSRRG